MKIWVVAEKDAGGVKKVTLEMLSKARELAGDDEVALVWIGKGFEDSKEKVSSVGASKVFVVDDDVFDRFLIQPQVDVVCALASEHGPDVLFVASSADGKDLGTRVAVRMKSGVTNDITSIRKEESRLVATYPAFGGNLLVECWSEGKPAVYVVKPNAFGVQPREGSPDVVTVDASSVQEGSKKAAITEYIESEKADRPAVDEAEIIVSGGRGLGGPENFAVVEALADVLGAAVGASRAAVDAGWYPHQHQVGQTGKTVSPNLYIACGISGAIQHRAGMQTSKHIVAINKDAEAPIFQICDFGVVGDLFKVVPALTEELKKRKGTG